MTTPGPLRVELIVEDARWEADLPDLRERLERVGAAAAAAEPRLCGDVALLLADDAALQSFNRQFRGKDKPTNVLSFPAENIEEGAFLGDIAIAFETTATEARAEGSDFGDHLAHLFTHGLLHLVGYDHETDHDAAVMETLETRILAAVGVADPYRQLPEGL